MSVVWHVGLAFLPTLKSLCAWLSRNVLMLRSHMSQKVILSQKCFSHRTTASHYWTEEAFEAFHFWMHRLHMPYKVFVVT